VTLAHTAHALHRVVPVPGRCSIATLSRGSEVNPHSAGERSLHFLHRRRSRRGSRPDNDHVERVVNQLRRQVLVRVFLGQNVCRSTSPRVQQPRVENANSQQRQVCAH